MWVQYFACGDILNSSPYFFRRSIKSVKIPGRRNTYMITIGLIGGMSWESTAEYYRILNETVRERLGGLHSARCLLYSVDFAEIEALQHSGQWQKAGQVLTEAAQILEQGGAGCIILCTNTMHKLAGAIQTGISIPFLHIADATAEQICAQGYTSIGLLGTRFTMEEDFYSGRLSEKYALRVLTPPLAAREMIHNVIYNELCLGIVREDSRAAYREAIQQLVDNGAQAVILGCTEIGLLVKDEDSPVPLFDTTRIHAEAAVEWALRANDF
jgi:aspartate racemase